MDIKQVERANELLDAIKTHERGLEQVDRAMSTPHDACTTVTITRARFTDAGWDAITHAMTLDLSAQLDKAQAELKEL